MTKKISVQIFNNNHTLTGTTKHERTGWQIVLSYKPVCPAYCPLAESEFQIDKNPYLAYEYMHKHPMNGVKHLTKPKTGCNYFQHDKKGKIMKYFLLVFWACLFALLPVLPASAGSDAVTGKQLAQDVFNRDRGKNSVLTSQMVLVDKNDNKRVRQFTSRRILENALESQIIRFTFPADIEGTGFLTIEKPGWETEQFIYLPALRRTRRIVTSQKSHRFVNSDFTYEDMERHPVDDYTYKITGSQTIGGVACHAMETRPKKDVHSQYSLTQSLITKDSLVPILVKYFDKKGHHIKTYKVLKLEKIQDIWTELIISMEDHEREHSTFLKIESITYNTDIDQADISRNRLENY